jgi:DNA-binding response OmpR family regulator
MRSDRVLAVVDDGMVLNMIDRALSLSGYQVTKVSTADKAFAVLDPENFALVITDLQLGADDAAGITVLQKTKELNPLIMVIIITGNPSATAAIEAFRSGADDYLLKPFSIAELTAQVDHCMAKQDQQERLASQDAAASYKNERTPQMLTVMAHDIRASLVSMALSVKLLRKGALGKLPDGVDRELMQLAGRFEKLLGMSEEYLQTIFLLEEGDTYEMEALELQKDVIAPVLDEFAVDILENDITVEFMDKMISTQKTVIHASKALMKAAVRNIVNNAIKYGGKGGTIGFFLGKMNDYYLVDISNSRSVIPKSKLPTLFKMPERISKKTWLADGAGIGLYLTKKIIQQHRGVIWYENIENKSHFFFTVPNSEG